MFLGNFLRIRQTAGLSLIEVIVSMVIIAAIGLVLYQSLSQGLRVWKIANRPDADVEDSLFVERIAGELRSACPFKKGHFLGDQTSFGFYTLMPSSHLHSKGDRGDLLEIVHIGYAYDSGKAALMRSEKDYASILADNRSLEESKESLRGINGIKLRYFSTDRKGRPVWAIQWKKPCPPKAIRISIERDARDGQSMHWTVPIMSSGCARGQS